MIKKRLKIKNSKFKTCPPLGVARTERICPEHSRGSRRVKNAVGGEFSRTERAGAALLVVLFVIMTITILSLGFLSRSDVELACGENMILRSQMDYLAESGLLHARGLILHSQDAGSEYWAGAVGQQLVVGGDDYYDVEIVRNDSDPANRCNYIIDCNSYRLKNGERIGSSSIRAELRLDPCIAYWAGLSTTISPLTVVNGDVYCAADLSNNGSINGDVFAAGTITGINITGQKTESAAQPPVAWPALEISDFSSTYYIGSVSYSVDPVGSSVHPSGSFNPSAGNPAGVRYLNGDLELLGNVDIEGMLVVNGVLRVSGGNNVISAVKNFPALFVNGDVMVESSSSLDVNGLVVIKGKMQVSADNANVSILGGLFVEDEIVQTTADSSANGNTGVLYNGPTWRPTGGKIDGALEFNGSKKGVMVGTDGVDSQQGTISMWAYAEGFDSYHHYLFGHMSQAGWFDRIQLYTNDENGWLDLGLGDAHERHTNIQMLDAFRWYHIALTWDGTEYTVYVDGASKASGSYTGFSEIGPVADIGNDGNPAYRDESFYGIIDEVRIYNRVLDVNDIYPPKDGLAGLVGHWKLDDSGSDVTITAAPSKTAIEVWPQAGVAQRWEQAGGAFFRSIERK